MKLLLAFFAVLSSSPYVLSQLNSTSTITAPLRTKACDLESVCEHFFADGKLYKVMTDGDATVSVALSDTGKYLRADVVITNNATVSVDILPDKFALKSLAQDARDLKYVPPQKMIATAHRRAAWGNAIAAAGAGMQQNQSTTQSSTNGNVSVYGSDGGSANGTYSGTTTSTTSAPDYAAQQRTQQQIAQHRADLAAASGDLLANSLLATTLLHNQTKAGRVYFERNRHHEETLLLMPIGPTMFQFPFTFKK